jgi:hypothetical protein
MWVRANLPLENFHLKDLLLGKVMVKIMKELREVISLYNDISDFFVGLP